MGVTFELENLGDAQLCPEIVARVEHAFSDKKGEWRVSIAGSRESESWEMRVQDRTDSSGRTLFQELLESTHLKQSAD
jgi:hypothetical protein